MLTEVECFVEAVGRGQEVGWGAETGAGGGVVVYTYTLGRKRSDTKGIEGAIKYFSVC